MGTTASIVADRNCLVCRVSAVAWRLDRQLARHAAYEAVPVCNNACSGVGVLFLCVGFHCLSLKSNPMAGRRGNSDWGEFALGLSLGLLGDLCPLRRPGHASLCHLS